LDSENSGFQGLGIDAWLLSDEEAISRVTQSRSGRPARRVNDPPESIEQPRKYHRILWEARVAYTDVVAAEIAKESDSGGKVVLAVEIFD